MRKRLGIVVAAFFYYSGLVKLARWLTKRLGPRLIILNYHDATGGDLRRHMLYLRRHYRILHLEEALAELYGQQKEPAAAQGRGTLLVLTFDDGYSDNYTHAFALARELQVPITLFLIPGYVESGEYFWWREGERLVRRTPMDKVSMEGQTYQLNQRDERKALAQAIDHRLRHAPSVAQREAFLAFARQALAVPASRLPQEEPNLPLKWTQVREMEESGWVSFGAHTMHHPILAYLSDPVEVQREVGDCRRMLEQRLGHPVRAFAYPVGRPEHIGDWGVRAVQEAGYNWAVTTIDGINTPQSDPHQLRRVLGDVSRNWLVMAAEVSGVWRLFSPLWKWQDAFFGKV
ncbi:MAG: polysaccharide deacetylase family protein [Ktedonobacteraceae bacterium]